MPRFGARLAIRPQNIDVMFRKMERHVFPETTAGTGDDRDLPRRDGTLA